MPEHNQITTCANCKKTIEYDAYIWGGEGVWFHTRTDHRWCSMRQADGSEWTDSSDIPKATPKPQHADPLLNSVIYA